MSKNKLYNQSYFVKRILDAGFYVTRLNVKFEPNDHRRWMILINSRDGRYRHNICVTCFKNPNSQNFMFKIQGQGERDFELRTMSMTTIINILNNVIKTDENDYINHIEESTEDA